MGQSGEEWYDGTKIRPYFESRQAFLGPIVFGFCLGGGALQEAYKIKRVNELHDQQLTADHDEFAKNYHTKPPLTGFTHFFLRGFGAQKFPSYQECGGTEGQVSALRRLTLDRDRGGPAIPVLPLPHHQACGSAPGGSVS